MAISTRRIGDATEYRAIIWLWDQGFEVFLNTAGDGPIDLVVVGEGGEVFLVDVKKPSRYVHTDGTVGYGAAAKSEVQLRLKVRYLFETDNGFAWQQENTR